MKRSIVMVILLIASFTSIVAECRFGGGRSLGSRGSRGMVSPRTYRPGGNSNYGNSYSSPQRSAPQPVPPAYTAPPTSNHSFLKTMGAGLAGGFLGNMLFRSLGFGGMGSGLGGFGGGMGSGFGVLEFILLLGLIFVMFKLLAKKPAASSTGSDYSRPEYPQSENFRSENLRSDTRDDEASRLMREARPNGWENNWTEPSMATNAGHSESIDRDQAMDLFFQVQGAWSNRDLSSAATLMDGEVRKYLEEEIYRLRAAKQINRLENIAVRNVQVLESWREMNKDFSTVQFTANLLDFTVDENTQQVVSGSKTTPVKFEEFWTFAKEPGSPWRLTAIQQDE